jgi:thioredoxin 1
MNDANLDEEKVVESLKMKVMHDIQRQALSQQNQNDVLRSLNGKAIDLNDVDFASTVAKFPLMLVDFWAPWCGPCRMVSPIVDQLAKQYAGKIAFGRLNVDENQLTSSKFGLQGIPTLLIFQNGKAVDGLVGAYPKQVIESRLKMRMTQSNP